MTVVAIAATANGAANFLRVVRNATRENTELILMSESPLILMGR